MQNITSRTVATELPMATLTVRVPEGTEAAFQKVVEAWCEAAAGPAAASILNPPSPDELLSAATEWWKTLNANERAVWNLWIAKAPGLVPASQIVSTLGLKSASSIKGVVNRMAGKGSRVGFQVGWQSHIVDPITKERLYGVRDFGTGEYPYDRITLSGSEYADLLREARAAAENA